MDRREEAAPPAPSMEAKVGRSGWAGGVVPGLTLTWTDGEKRSHVSVSVDRKPKWMAAWPENRSNPSEQKRVENEVSEVRPHSRAPTPKCQVTDRKPDGSDRKCVMCGWVSARVCVCVKLWILVSVVFSLRVFSFVGV